jgi:hypothetical protein
MSDPVTHARTAIPSCSLSPDGLQRQRARHAGLAPQVVSGWREGEALVLCFAEGYDRELLAEMVAVERECCPFFRFAVDDAERSLTVRVDDPAYAPALDALAGALGVGSRTS